MFHQRAVGAPAEIEIEKKEKQIFNSENLTREKIKGILIVPRDSDCRGFEGKM